MSIEVPIRPGAALNDPETRQHVEDRIINGKWSFPARHSYIKHAFDPEGIVNILANYPWREFCYKAARWQRQPFASELAFLPIRVWEVDSGPLALIDPIAGTEVAQIQGAVTKCKKPGGRVLFAGDPNYSGVISVHVESDNERNIAIVGSARIAKHPQSYTEIAEKAAELTRSMTPERTPEARLYNFPKNYLKTLGPWIADHPEKPPRKGVAGTFNS